MPNDVLEWWERLFGAQAAPNAMVPTIAAAIALAAVLLRGPWRLTRTVITIVHEAGHAVVAVLSGRRLQGIMLHSDTSGVTVSRGKRTGPGMVLTALAGYPAPAVLGLLFSVLIVLDRSAMVLVIAAVLLLGVLVMVRNAFGVVAVVATAGILGVLAYFGTTDIKAALVSVIAWFLLFGSLRAVFELQSKRRRGTARDSDADQLGRLTGVPAMLWVLVMGVIAVLCLVVGGTQLVEPVFGDLATVRHT